MIAAVYSAVYFITRDNGENKNVEVVNEPAKESQENVVEVNKEDTVNYPLNDSLSRITKKPFGIYITPQNSPVSPERFSGYHTGTDFEIFDDEKEKSVEVKTVCDGEILRAGKVSGYGGLVVQDCTINEQVVTVLYGHLNLSDLRKLKLGSTLEEGAVIAKLGEDKSLDTNGERKHLHLGIHKGGKIDVWGYVNAEKELEGWIDFESL